ncbi:hypothetical protein J2Z32_001402 [Paenibacillus turicensis]|uniref:Uncharacterized protein n=1 Tax=Paenibacillus turicensis TaxID=160487 RepID=A0ABS4FQC3_9BACL|nr:hypothetical protein [Paenibacillus turicensis]
MSLRETVIDFSFLLKECSIPSISALVVGIGLMFWAAETDNTGNTQNEKVRTNQKRKLFLVFFVSTLVYFTITNIFT